MSALHDLHRLGGQSPWLDNLRRDWLEGGELARWLQRGVRGVTSNPSIFQKAITGTDAYDPQFDALLARGLTVTDAYWEMVVADIVTALDLLAPVYDSSEGTDGFVSLEVAPALARDTGGTLAAARRLHEQINRPNLMIKIPGTVEGLPAVAAAVAEGINVNVTLLFSVERYAQVIDAHMDGLEVAQGPLDQIAGVASFFVSRVDSEVDRRLDEIGSPAALALKGRAAVANAQLAYGLFLEKMGSDRWSALAARGARPQRPLWASTSTKDPSYPPTLYVDTLVAPDTVNTMPEATLEAFEQHGSVARTADAHLDEARRTIDALGELGIDLTQVTDQLEADGIAAFATAFDELIGALQAKATAQGAPALLAEGGG